MYIWEMWPIIVATYIGLITGVICTGIWYRKSLKACRRHIDHMEEANNFMQNMCIEMELMISHAMQDENIAMEFLYGTKWRLERNEYIKMNGDMMKKVLGEDK